MQELSPIDWALRPLRRYADFSGRAPRPEYWWFWLATMLLNIVLQILTRISAVFGLFGIVYLALIIPMIAVGVRRLHDTNRSGWWILAPAVPYFLGFALIIPAIMSGGGVASGFASFGPAMIFMLIGFILAIVVFIFTVLPGTKGPNRFGPDPYDEDNLEEVFA
jgi:uncharacterized membrane protein YhaH (DUF805 family)